MCVVWWAKPTRLRAYVKRKCVNCRRSFHAICEIEIGFGVIYRYMRMGA